jgi:hypothetical protein
MASLRFRSVALPLALGLASAAIFGVACKQEKEAETGGYLQGGTQYPVAGAAGASSYAGSGGQTWSPQAGAGGSGVVAGAGGLSAAGGAVAAGGRAQAIDASAASVVQPLLNELAKKHAVAGSKPLGAPIVANFQPGQTFEAQIQLQPQKCYTVVATALPPITELNVEITLATPLANLSPVLAVDSETGTTAVVGKKPNCYKWAMPLGTPAKVVLRAAAGSGLAAAQVYEK